MRYSNELNEIGAALAQVQAEIKNPIKDQINKGVQGQPKYANLEDTLSDYVRPVCSKHGISVIQSLNTNENKQVGVCTMLLHKSGQYIISDYVYCDVIIPISKQGKEVLTQGQATGVCITYLRRYSLNSALGINGDKDTDGSFKENDPLTYETALEYEITFGKYNGLTLGELFEKDASYIKYLENKGDDEIKQAIALIKEENEKQIAEMSKPREPEYPEVKCPDCGIQMLKTKIDGVMYTPQETLDKLGCCADCFNKKKNAKTV